MSPLEEIAAERRRQIEQEGFSPAHDAQYRNYELAAAASAYAHAAQASDHRREFLKGYPRNAGWPWLPQWWKPTTRRRDLIKAGALILAQLEQMGPDA